MAVRGPGDSPKTQHTHSKDQKLLPKNQQAIQAESEGGLLTKIQSEHTLRFKSYFIIGKIETFFTQRTIKKKYIRELATVFSSQAAKQGLNVPLATETFKHWIEPALRSAHSQDIPHFEKFVCFENGLVYFIGVFDAYPKNSIQGVKALKNAINTTIQAVKKAPEQVERILQHHKNTQILFSKLHTADQHLFLDTFLGKLQNDAADYSTTIQNHEDFVNQASTIPTFHTHLASKSSKDRTLFLKFSMTPGGHAYLMKAMQIHSNNPEKITEVIDDSISCQKVGNTQLLYDAFTYFPRVAQIIDRMQPEHTFDFFEAWMKNSTELAPTQFEEFLKKYEEHLELIEKIQAARPKIFNLESPEVPAIVHAWFHLHSSEDGSSFAEQAKRLASFKMVLHDATFVENTQVLEYSISSLYLGPTQAKARTVSDLKPRLTDTRGEDIPFGLCNQISAVTLKDRPDDEIIENFEQVAEVNISDPYSMETYTIRIPLPITGTMTVGEAKKQLELLSNFIASPNNFETKYDQLGFPKKNKDEIKERFSKFSNLYEQELAHALMDFNSTHTFPRRSIVLQQPQIAASMNAPHSKALAIEAAKAKNIFRLDDKTLSLIPSGPGELHKDIGAISEKELVESQLVLKQKLDSTTILIPTNASDETEMQEARLSITTQTEMIDQIIPYLTMETTISLDGQTLTRKTYYELADRSEEQLKDEIIRSKLFERDLLLAKSEFMEKNVK